MRKCIQHIGDKGIIISVAIWLLLASETLACPKDCQCKWRNGKQWAICSKAKFIDVPRGLESSTQVLNLEDNNLKILFKDAFFDRGLVNLQKIFLNRCNLRKLDNGCFRKLANLIELDLDNNMLTSFPYQAFDDVRGLRVLKISRNRLAHVPNDAFSTTKNLVHLDISYNQICNISVESFRYMSRLEILKISGNKLTTIHINTLRYLVALHEFHVHYNLWHCDCSLRTVRKYMDFKNVATSVPPMCTTPKHLQNMQWKNISYKDFHCQPEAKAVETNVFTALGNNVTLMCIILNDIEVTFSWGFGNTIYNNNTSLLSRHSVSVQSMTKNFTSRKSIFLHIKETEKKDEGEYSCMVRNSAGIDEALVRLHVMEITPINFAFNDTFIAKVFIGAVIMISLSAIAVSGLLFKKYRVHRALLIKSNNRNGLSVELCRGTKTSFANNLNHDYKSIPTSEAREFLQDVKPTNSVSVDLPANNVNKMDGKIAYEESSTTEFNKEDNGLYVEISTGNNIEPKDSPILKILAKQCKEEIARRRRIKQSMQIDIPKNIQMESSIPDILTRPSELLTLPRSKSSSFSINASAGREIYGKSSITSNGSLYEEPTLTAQPDNSYSSLQWSHCLTNRRRSFTASENAADVPYEEHATQLDTFLQEYQILRQELMRIRESERILGLDKEENSLNSILGYHNFFPCVLNEGDFTSIQNDVKPEKDNHFINDMLHPRNLLRSKSFHSSLNSL